MPLSIKPSHLFCFVSGVGRSAWNKRSGIRDLFHSQRGKGGSLNFLTQGWGSSCNNNPLVIYILQNTHVYVVK